MTRTPSYTAPVVGAKPSGAAGQGGLQMLVIEHETTEKGSFDASFSVLFNPTNLSTETVVGWKPQETVQATGAPPSLSAPTSPAPTSLTLDLFFDTTLRNPEEGALARASASLMSQARSLVGATGAPSGSNVLPLTSRVFALTQVAQELHRPPLCRLWWGENFIMCGVLTKLHQEFQRFLADGTPTRARLGCTFTEHTDPLGPRRELHSPDVLRTHVVARGDTLTRLAATYYGDPTAWRTIANANALRDPRDLTPGAILLIPKLQ